MEPSTSAIKLNEDENDLGWKDYLAFIIAAFETVLAPVLIFVVVLMVLLFVFRAL